MVGAGAVVLLAELALDMVRRLLDEPAIEAHDARAPVGDGARDFKLDHAANRGWDVAAAHDTGLGMHLRVVPARDHTADVWLLHASEHGGQPRLFRDDGALDDHARRSFRPPLAPRVAASIAGCRHQGILLLGAAWMSNGASRVGTLIRRRAAPRDYRSRARHGRRRRYSGLATHSRSPGSPIHLSLASAGRNH